MNKFEEELKKETARVSNLPCGSGDGYGYGGGMVVTIGNHSVLFGEGRLSQILAKEVARRWNAAIAESERP